MANKFKVKLHRWSVAWHRDLGYFFSSLIIIYCISGLALNHVDDWNPDFIIQKKTIQLPKVYQRAEVVFNFTSPSITTVFPLAASGKKKP